MRSTIIVAIVVCAFLAGALSAQEMKTQENLDAAFGGETYETSEMYPEFYETAVEENDSRAQETFREAMEVEAIHAVLYERAKESVDAGRDMPLERVYVCPVCGTHLLMRRQRDVLYAIRRALSL